MGSIHTHTPLYTSHVDNQLPFKMASHSNDTDTGVAPPEGSSSSSSSPKFTPYHPLIPKLYICAWKQDMKNRDLIVENCKLSELSYQAEDSLYLEKRERLNNVEPRDVVMRKGEKQGNKKTL